ncbi:MAG: hypothetical protein BGO07_00735 [Alphaproteobacteria bacterium 40-19]|nr:MAG: hypothetical protein BGO07_00735 [Alphaproteobacteria bacterium 40-19]
MTYKQYKIRVTNFLNSSWGLAIQGLAAVSTGIFMTNNMCFLFCPWCIVENGLLIAYGLITLLQIKSPYKWVKFSRWILWNLGWPVGLYHASLQMVNFPLIQKGVQIGVVFLILGLLVRLLQKGGNQCKS